MQVVVAKIATGSNGARNCAATIGSTGSLTSPVLFAHRGDDWHDSRRGRISTKGL